MFGYIAQRTAVYVSAGILLLMCGFPLYWMVLTSIKPDREIIQAIPTFFTWDAHLDASQRLFTTTRFLTYFINSITVAGGATLPTILVAVLAAYAITRFRFRGREFVARTMLFTYMFAPRGGRASRRSPRVSAPGAPFAAGVRDLASSIERVRTSLAATEAPSASAGLATARAPP